MFSGEGHARPTAPSRRSTVRTSAPMAPLMHVELTELRGLSDHELFAIGPANLQAALKLSWEDNVQMAGCIELAQLHERGLRDRLDDVVGSLTEAVARYEQALQDQSRLESEVQSRNDLLERLRQRLTTKEAELRDNERRYAEQEMSFDAERLAFLSQEANLRVKISSRTISSRHFPVIDGNHLENDALRKELEMTAASREALQKHLDALIIEVHDLKKINSQLRDENDGWQTLLTDQTICGSIKKGSGVLARVLSGAEVDERGTLSLALPKGEYQRKKLSVWADISKEHEEDEPQTDMMGNVENQHPEEYVPDHFDSLRSTKRPKGESLENIPVTGSGLDLAAELGRAEVYQGGKMRALRKGDEGETLRAEVKHLRDANKALSMYCSKIIDRIIAKEGYEDVLNVDYTKNLATVGESSRRPKQRNGLSARQMESTLQKSDIVSRPCEQIKGERRARRGMSMDWGLGKVFKSFNGPTKASETTRPGLRPLSLSMNPAGLSTALTLGARKLEAHDEDEEDARERHRMQAALKLMGVVEETQALSAILLQSPAERGAGRYWLPGLHEAVDSGQDPTPPRIQKAHDFAIEP